MSGEYQVRVRPGARLEQRAMHFAVGGTIALALLAAIPAGLGLLQQAILNFSSGSSAISGQNAAATARALGNQPPKPALAKDVTSMRGAKEGILALCSGTSGTNAGARVTCAPLASAIQR